MSSRDERVVEMRFENAQFEKGVSQSLVTLDKLKSALKLDHVADGLRNIENSVSKFTLGNVSKAVALGIDEFSNFGIMGVTALQRITNAAIDTGEAIVRQVVLPMRSGFQEYETQINSVQTILANTSSKGTTLDQVNEALDELNHYADMTIYNFTEMTKNIGTFTAAGVDLDKSVSAIKGIANLAAVSGSSSQQASTAMYQLSQALAAGTVRLMDWNSVVNAGMGGEVFQNALKETARVHGIAIDDMIAKEGSFRETLKNGWLSAEILTETLSKFTGDLTEDQLRSIGYTEEQIKEIIKLGEMANDAATKVKTFTQLFDTLGEAMQSGWTQTWEIIIGDFEEAKAFLTDVSDLLGDVINKSSNRRNNFLESILGPTSKSAITIKMWDNFAKTGFASEEFKNALIDRARESGIAIDDLIAKYGSFEATLKEGWLTRGLFNDTVNSGTEGMGKSLEELKQVVEEVEDGLWGNADTGRYEKLAEAGWDWHLVQQLVNQDLLNGGVDWDNLTEEQLASLGATQEQIAAFQELKDAMSDNNSEVNKALESSDMTGRELIVQSVLNVLHGIVDILGIAQAAWANVFPAPAADTIRSILEGIYNFTQNLNFSAETGVKIGHVFEGLFSIFGIIADAGGAVAEVIKNIFANLPKGDKNALDNLVELGDKIVAFRQKLKDNKVFETFSIKATAALLGFARGVSETLGQIKSWLRGEDVEFTYLKKLRDWMARVYTVIRQFNIGNALSSFRDFLAGKGVNLDWLNDLVAKFKNVTIGDVIDKIKSKIENLKKMFNLGGVDIFSNIGSKISSLLSGLKAPSLPENFNVLEYISQKVNDFTSWLGGLNIESDFHPLQAISDFLSGIDWGSALSGISSFIDNIFWKFIAFMSVGGLAGVVNTIHDLKTAIDNITDGFTDLIDKITGHEDWPVVVAFAGAVAVLTISLYSLSRLDPEKLAQGLGGLAGVLGELAGGLWLIRIATAGGFVGVSLVPIMLAFSISVSIMAGAAKKLGEMNLGDLAKGVVAVAILGVIMAGMTRIITFGGFPLGNFGKAFASVAIAVAISIVAYCATKLGEINFGDLAKGVVAVAILGVIMAGLTRILTPNFGSIFGGISTLLIAGAIDNLADVIAKLSEFNIPTLVKCTVTIAVLGLVLEGLSALGSYFSGTIGAIFSGFSLGLISDAIDDLSGVIEKLEPYSLPSLFKCVGVIALLGLILEGLSALGGYVGGGLKNLISGISIDFVASALSKLADAAVAIKDLGLQEIGEDLAFFGGALGELVIAGAIASIGPVAVGLFAIAAAATALGVGIGIALWGLGKFIDDLNELYETYMQIDGNEGKSFSDFLSELTSGISENADEIGKAAGVFAVNFIAGIIQGLVENAYQLLEIGVDIATIIGSGLNDMVDATVLSMTGFVQFLFDAILAAVHAPGALKEVVDNFFAFFNSFFQDDVDTTEAANNLVNSLFKAIATAVKESPLLSFIWDGLMGLINNVAGWLGAQDFHIPLSGEMEFDAEGNLIIKDPKPKVEIPSSMTVGGGGGGAEPVEIELTDVQWVVTPAGDNGFGIPQYAVTNSLGETLTLPADMLIDMAVDPSNFIFDVGENAELLNSFGQPINDALAAVDISEGTDEAVSNIVAGLQDVENHQQELMAAGGSAGNDIIEGVDGPEGTDSHSPSKKAKASAGNVIMGLVEGLKENGSLILSSIRMLFDGFFAEIDSKKPIFQTKGQELIQFLANGLSINSSLAADGVRNAMEYAVSAAYGYSGRFYSLGLDAAKGLADGIRVGSSYAITESINLAANSLKAAKATLDSNSPSKKFMQLGYDSDLGMAIGFRNGSGLVEDSASSVGNAVLDAMMSTISLIDRIANDDFEMSPVVTPVVDLTNLQNAKRLLDLILYDSNNRVMSRIEAIDEATSERSDDYRTLNIYVDGAVVNDDEEIRAGALNMLYGLKRKAAL